MKWLGTRRRVMQQRVLSAKEGRCLLIWEMENQIFLEDSPMEICG